jgi:transposase
MDLNDYERHLVGLLCWSCHAATGHCNARQRQCPRCRKKWSYDRRRTQWELLKAFCLNATAHHAARFARCDYRTAYRAYMHHRLTLGEMTAEEKRPLLGELELDESYFGGKRKGKRGRGAPGKVAVFGILERDGKVYTVAVPDCKKETLMAKITSATVKGSVFYTDEFVSYKDLSRYGKHVPIDHREEFADGEAHINGIEGFWSYAKRLHRLCHGVDRENFPVYLAEYEFRYNHRDDHLLTILFDRLYRPLIEKGRLP